MIIGLDQTLDAIAALAAEVAKDESLPVCAPPYRVISLRKRTPLGPYRRPMPRVVGGP